MQGLEQKFYETNLPKDSPRRQRSNVALWLAYLLPDPAALGSFLSIPKFFIEEKIVNVAEVNQRHCLEESGQWLENVGQNPSSTG